MKNQKLFLFLSLVALMFLPGCEVIVGIFQAGFWTAVILIVLIIASAFYAYMKFKKRR